jgi:hypothetical protein
MRGVQYQDLRDALNTSRTFIDPLEDGARCARDIPHLKELGVNTLYIQALRAESEHSSCMGKLRDAGIYVLVNFETLGVDTDGWTYTNLQKWVKIMDSLSGYSNLLAFWTDAFTSESLPFTKAAIRDIKDYLRTSRSRAIPVGYMALNHNDFDFSRFLACGGHDISADFIFLQTRESCRKDSAKNEVQQSLQQIATLQTDIPLFIFGNGYGTACNTSGLASSGIMLSIYGGNNTAVHSGAIMFQYFDYPLMDNDGMCAFQKSQRSS